MCLANEMDEGEDPSGVFPINCPEDYDAGPDGGRIN
jgi:hypothetical protein